jgi:very-short-patch-repair endonuclease
MSIARARELRQTMTAWEIRLWGRLRKDQLGVRFRRQHPIENYITDFACIPAKLIAEADGDHHRWYGQDQHRDAWLAAQGWRVMRYENRQIQWELDDVCRGIYQITHERLAALPAPPAKR